MNLLLVSKMAVVAATVMSVNPIWAQEHKQTPMKPIKEVFTPNAPADLSKYMKVAVVQWNPYQDAPVGASKVEIKKYLNNNRQQMGQRVEQAAKAGAKFIVLSEFAVVGYPDIPDLPPEEDEFRNRQDVKDFVDTIPGDSTNYFSKIAAKNKVWIQFGMAEVDSKTDKYFNAAVVINDTGKIAASFRKINLFKLENDFLSAGSTPVTFQSPMGKVGLAICADIYDYSLLGTYRAQNVDVISLSTSWAQMNTGMTWFKKAAVEVGSYVLAANQTYFPDSGVINRDGTTQSHIRQSRDSIAYGYVPLKAAQKK